MTANKCLNQSNHSRMSFERGSFPLEPINNRNNRSTSFQSSSGSNRSSQSQQDPEQQPQQHTNPQMTLHSPPKNIYRVISACVWVLGAGMTDGVLGSLLPHIEKQYNINYAIVSLLWLGNALGWVLIGFTGHYLDDFIGKWKSLILSAFCYIIMSSILASGTLFPVLVVGLFFGGVGGAIGLSQLNIFLSKLGPKYLGIYHGCYGVGACAGPLLATVMTDRGLKWNYFYFCLLGLSLINTVSMMITFKGCDEDLKPYYNDDSDEAEAGVKKNHDFVAALNDLRTWLGCIFIFFYQGSEVSMGGWVVTFILNYRKGNPSTVGFVSSGFWAGVTVGRFFLTSSMIEYIGSRRSVIILAVLCIAFDILTWLIPEQIAAGVFASLAGVFIGPIVPILYSFFARTLPRRIKFCSMMLMTAFGSSGGSAVPFMVGMLSQVSGTYVLHPIFLACYAVMFIVWIMMPNIERKGAHKNLWQKFW